MTGESHSRPFVTVGVTTYNRHDLLRQTLDTILAQTFTDFEVIVGNDYTAEVLTKEMFGITDSRVIFINHPKNLGEVGNMNALLGMAKGRYFTWIFDDDLYEPNFLQAAHDCLAKAEFPPAFFSSFRFLGPGDKFQPKQIPQSATVEFTGREFLRWYSPRRMQIASVLGVFDVSVLRDTIGGMPQLIPIAIGVYGEYLLLVRCGLLDKIVYLDSPLVIYRIHPGSWSDSPFELATYIKAGKKLICKCAEILRHPSLNDDFDVNLMMICEQHLVTVAYRSAKLEGLNKTIGILSLNRAAKRYREEAIKTKDNYVAQGGNNGIRTKVYFIKINLNCYRLIAVSIAGKIIKRFFPAKHHYHS